MIGYPNGLWDDINNLPIVRSGLTATPIKYDYRGRKEFLIDSACFPGSSGSPVFIYNEGSFSTSTGITLGSRFFLAGIMYAGPQITLEGSIVFSNNPSVPHIESQSMMNLEMVIKAEKLLDFEKLLEQLQ